LAVVFAEAGFDVMGMIPIPQIDALNRGSLVYPDVPTETVAKLVKSGKLKRQRFRRAERPRRRQHCVRRVRKTGDPDMSFILRPANKWQSTSTPAWWLCSNRPLIRARPAS